MKPFGNLLLAGLFCVLTLESFAQQTWTERKAVDFLSPTLRAVIWTGTKLVAVGGNRAMTSSDGVDWEEQVVEPLSSFNEELYSVAWTGSTVVAVGASGSVATSPDGITWTKRSPFAWFKNNGFLSDVIWTGSQLVAVGGVDSADIHNSARKGIVQTSPDGIVWTERDPGTTQDLLDVVWTGTHLIAVGDSGTVVTSPDGKVWTKNSSGITVGLSALTWTGSLAVALGDSSRFIFTSPDGIDWTPRPLMEVGTLLLKSITWTGSQLVAVGGFGSVYSSPDGIDWTFEYSESNTWNWLYDVTWTGNLLVAVGKDGSVFTSPQVPNRTISAPKNTIGKVSVRLTAFSLVATLPISLLGQNLRATIYDISGIRAVDVDAKSIGREISVPIQGVPNGRYLLDITSTNHRISQPIFLGR